MQCRNCGETRPIAIRKGLGICHNCSDYNTSKSRLVQCPICGANNTPSEYHHIAGRNINAWFGISICCNCHFILTYRQVKHWIKHTSNTVHILQGCYDVIYLMTRVNKWYSFKSTWLTIFEIMRHVGIAICESEGFVLWR